MEVAKKKKLKKHQRPAPEQSLSEKLLILPSWKLQELDSKYKILDDEGKLNARYEDREKQGKYGRKKSKTEKRRERITRANQPKLASFFRKNSPQPPSTPNIRVVHEYIERPFKKEYTVQWDNVTFEDRYLVIKGVVPRKTVDLFFKPAQASFNFIKRRIAQRLIPFKIQVSNGQAWLVDDIYISEIVDYLECKDFLEQIIESGQSDYRGYYDRIPSHLSSLFFPEDKKEYLDILCDLQSDKHKIIPVSEAIGDTIEDSFLFTVDKESSMYIIWENTNLSRATYIFCVDPDRYGERAQFVFDYLVSNAKAKRQRLHSNSIDREIFGNFEILNHTDTEVWKMRLMQIMK